MFLWSLGPRRQTARREPYGIPRLTLNSGETLSLFRDRFLARIQREGEWGDDVEIEAHQNRIVRNEALFSCRDSIQSLGKEKLHLGLLRTTRVRNYWGLQGLVFGARAPLRRLF